jgi:hypothetical protein
VGGGGASGRAQERAVVDILTLALTHGLMAIAVWRLLWRDDLGRDPGDVVTSRRPWLREPADAGGGTD